MTNQKKILFSLGILLSLAGWIAYVFLSIIMGQDLGDEEFSKKYFTHFPRWLAGFYKIGIAIWISLVAAVIFTLSSGAFLKKKALRNFSLVVLILDIIVFLMSFMLFI